MADSLRWPNTQNNALAMPPRRSARADALLFRSAKCFFSRGTEQQRATWSHATTSFALFLAAAAHGFSWIYAHTGGDYLVLFGLGGGAVVLALAIDLAFALTMRKQ
ncbi:hypothetical protein ABIB73_006223 [Bradyrhizobium sp. F1.4.3]